MDDELASEVTTLLYAGMIHGCDCDPAIYARTDASSLAIFLNRAINSGSTHGSVLSMSNELAFTLGHENGHRHQYLGDRLIPPNALLYPTNPTYERILEADADLYAKQHVRLF